MFEMFALDVRELAEISNPRARAPPSFLYRFKDLGELRGEHSTGAVSFYRCWYRTGSKLQKHRGEPTSGCLIPARLRVI